MKNKMDPAARIWMDILYWMSLLSQILIFSTAKGQNKLGYDGWFYLVAVTALEVTLIKLVFVDVMLTEKFFRYLYLGVLLTAWALILFLINAEGVAYFWMVFPMIIKIWYIQSFIYKDSN